jgi:hypothetical protein
MEEYQRQVYEERPKILGNPTPVQHDWSFHEERTGFDRNRICRLLPQLVAEELASDWSNTARGHGAPEGPRASDGLAWISDHGQFFLSQLRQPPLPLEVRLTSLGPQAEEQLHGLVEESAKLAVSKEDVLRLEDLPRKITTQNGTDKLGQAASIATLFQGSKELTVFMLAYVLPFLRTVMES